MQKRMKTLYVVFWSAESRDQSSMRFAKSQRKRLKLPSVLESRSYPCFRTRELTNIVSTCVHTYFLSNRWLQNKGDVEEIAKKAEFPHISIFRPGITLNLPDTISIHLLDSLSSSISVGALVHIMRLEAGNDPDRE